MKQVTIVRLWKWQFKHKKNGGRQLLAGLHVRSIVVVVVV